MAKALPWVESATPKGKQRRLPSLNRKRSRPRCFSIVTFIDGGKYGGKFQTNQTTFEHFSKTFRIAKRLLDRVFRIQRTLLCLNFSQVGTRGFEPPTPTTPK
jgi:hypothetical protein